MREGMATRLGWLRNLVAAVAIMLGGVVIGALFSSRFEMSHVGAAGSSPPVTSALAAPPSPALAPSGQTPSLAPVAKAVMPAVVNISTTRVLRAPQGGEPTGPMLNDPFLKIFRRRILS